MILHASKLKLRELLKPSAAEDGTVTIEFVILFPLLIAWFLGSFIYFDAYRSKTLTAKVAYTMSDLVARTEDTIDTVTARSYYDIQERMMPRRIDESWIRISSICYREREVGGVVVESEYRIHWSTVFDDHYDVDAGEAPNINKYVDDSEIPVNLMPLMADGDSIIFTEVFAVWEPIAEQWAGYMGLKQLTWAQRVTERPRFLRVVPHAQENASNVCPAATWE